MTSTALNPSSLATSARRAPSVQNGCPLGRSSAQTMAAPICRASAARRGWRSRRRPACSRTPSVGSTSVQEEARVWRRSRATSTCRAEIIPSRPTRARAEAHSTEVPHQTTMPESRSHTARSGSVFGSSMISGITADVSQKITSLRLAPAGPRRNSSLRDPSAGTGSRSPRRARQSADEPVLVLRVRSWRLHTRPPEGARRWL